MAGRNSGFSQAGEEVKEREGDVNPDDALCTHH
jgi:hypothetical protein